MKKLKMVAALAFLFPALSHAADLKISSTVAMKGPLEAMKDNLGKGASPLRIEYGLSGDLKEKLLKGDTTCDLMISTKAAVADLVKAGKLDADGVVDINKSGVGLAVKKGAKKPVMATDEDVKRILLQADSVTYPKQGASFSVMNKVYQKLDITDQMQSKVRFPEHGDPMEAVAHGESQYVFAQKTELLGEPGIEHVAQLPPNLQTYTVFTAAPCAGSQDKKPAKELINRLTKPAAIKVYEDKGLEPL